MLLAFARFFLYLQVCFMFEIKILDTRKTSFKDIVSKYEQLPEKRKEKANRLQNEAQKVVCVESYYLVKEMLKFDKFPDFETGKFGKPFLENQKHFNISHSHGVIVVAVSDDEIGVDIEKKKEISNALANQICSNEELEQIGNKDNKNQEIIQKNVLKKCFSNFDLKIDFMKGVLQNFTFFQLKFDEK